MFLHACCLTTHVVFTYRVPASLPPAYHLEQLEEAATECARFRSESMRCQAEIKIYAYACACA
eukprot:scaffold78842_cov34-Phaeocystis_antarctica.AAC.2